MTKRTNSTSIFLLAFTAATGFASTGCDGDDDEAPKDSTTPTHIEVSGDWENTLFQEEDAIDDAAWSMTNGVGTDMVTTTDFVITSFDNATNTVILEDPSGKFNRWQWTDVDGDAFYYCMVAFNLDSAEDAENSTETADDSDPENSGCGGFSWTKLTKK
ncbi:MAG TPA: hypothetical protein VNN72_05725 [Polyangiaceae bacterium]|nr:hypothetical protein [Polyangiaceae bacterium]